MTQQQDPMAQAVSYVRYQGSKSLAEIDALLARTAADWERCLGGVTELQAEFAPQGQWCVKQVLGHFLATAGAVNKQVAGLAAGQPLEWQFSAAEEAGGGSESRRDVPIEGLRQDVAAAFEETRRMLASLKDNERLSQQFKHPLFGELSLKEWLAFQRIHSMDHIQQIEQIKAEPAYPGA
jgi:hypothetical protein